METREAASLRTVVACGFCGKPLNIPTEMFQLESLARDYPKIKPEFWGREFLGFWVSPIGFSWCSRWCWAEYLRD
jgi:hypothetical protein